MHRPENTCNTLHTLIYVTQLPNGTKTNCYAINQLYGTWNKWQEEFFHVYVQIITTIFRISAIQNSHRDNHISLHAFSILSRSLSRLLSNKCIRHQEFITSKFKSYSVNFQIELLMRSIYHRDFSLSPSLLLLILRCTFFPRCYHDVSAFHAFKYRILLPMFQLKQRQGLR